MTSHKSTLPKAVLDVKRQVDKVCGKPTEPGVLERLIDFQYEFVSQLIMDARQISQYLGKKEVDLEDLRLAKEMSEKETSFCPRPSKQTLVRTAQKINEIPLPAIKPAFGLRLPPDRFCMTTCNYQTEDVVDSVNGSQYNGTA